MKAAGNGKSTSKKSTPPPRPVLLDGDRGGFSSGALPQSYVRLQQQQYLEQQQHYVRQLEQQQHRYHQQQHPQHYQQRLAYQQQLFAQQQFAYQQQQQLPYVRQQQHSYRQQQQHNLAYQGDPQLAYQHLRREPPLPQQHSPAQQQELQQHYVQQAQGYQQHAPHDEGLHIRRPLQQQREAGHQQRLSSLPARGPLSRQQHQPYRRRQQHHYSLHQQEEDAVMHSVCTGGGSNAEGMETEGVASHYHYYEEPELRSRKDICSTAAAVLGVGRVTGVFLFVFAATVAAAIVFDTVGPPAHEYYISCHGSNVSVSHKVFLVLLSLQIFLIIVHWPLTAASSNVAAAVPPHHQHNRDHHHHHEHHTAGRVRQQYQPQYYQGHLQHKHGEEEEEEEEDEEQQRQQHLQPQQQGSAYSKASAHVSSSSISLYVCDGGGCTCSLNVSSLVPCHAAAGGGAAIESAGAAGRSAAQASKRDVAAMHGQAPESGSCSKSTLSLSCAFSSLASPPVPVCTLMKKQRSDAATSAAARPAALPTATAPAAPAAPPPAAAAPTKAAPAAAVVPGLLAGRAAAAAAGVPVVADAPAVLAAQRWAAFKTCSHEERCRIYSTFCQEEQQQRPFLKFVSAAVCASCPPDALESEGASAQGNPAYVPLESAAAAAVGRTRGGEGATPARPTAAEAPVAADKPATSESIPLVEGTFINGVERHSPRSMLLPNRDKESEAVTVECYYGGEVAGASLRESSRGPGVRSARLLLDSIVQSSSNRSSSRGRYIPAGGDTLDGSGDEEAEGNAKAGESLGSSFRYPPSRSPGLEKQQPEQQPVGSSRTSSTKSPSWLAADEPAAAIVVPRAAATAAAESGGGSHTSAAAAEVADLAGTDAAGLAQNDTGYPDGHEDHALRVVVTPAPAGADYAATTPPGVAGERKEGYWRLYGVDWNSVWTGTTYFIYALGFYAAVLGWRVYGGSTANYTTWSTCSHLDFPTFGADLPLMHSVVSDFTFVEAFATCAAHLLMVRKYLDPYRLSSYCLIFPLLLRGSYRPLLKTVFVAQLLLQAALYVVLAGNLLVCWTTGYGTPMQILWALMLVNVTLWVFSVLSHVLQADRMNPPLRPTLVYHWLWWIICLGIIWLCGFLFYFSVYGTYSTPFLLLHAVSWLLFLLLTYCKLPAVFPYWTSGNEDDYERQPPSLATVLRLWQKRGTRAKPLPSCSPHSAHWSLLRATPCSGRCRSQCQRLSLRPPPATAKEQWGLIMLPVSNAWISSIKKGMLHLLLVFHLKH